MVQSNKSEAVKIGIGLSTQFISAALGLLTLIGGIITFLLSEKDYSFEPVALLIVGVLSLVFSICCGFIGIARARNNGNRGWWIINVSKRFFDLQTGFGLLGLIAFAISIYFLLSTPTKEDPILKAIYGNQKSIESSLSILRSEISCDRLEARLVKLEGEMAKLKLLECEMKSSSKSKKSNQK